MHAMLSLKLGDHDGLTVFTHVWLLKRTLIFLLLATLIQILIRAFLSPDPAHCGVQSGTSWCRPAAAGRTPVPDTQLWETLCWFCIFCLISLIINIISVISKPSYNQFLSLSPFSSFSLSLVGGQGLTESVCCSVYCCPALNVDKVILRSCCLSDNVRRRNVFSVMYRLVRPVLIQL